MGGDGAELPGPVEELGSVGDWRMPSWMPHSGLAWLFIVLAVLAVLAHIPVVVEQVGWAAWLNPGELVGAVAISSPILFPAAVLWRTADRRPRLTGRLARGSLAIGIAAFFDSALSSPLPSWNPTFGGSDYHWDAFGGPGDSAFWIGAVILAVAGPVLLGNVVRSLRDGPASRQGIRAGVALGCLVLADLAFEATYAEDFLFRFVAPPYPGGLMLYGVGFSLPSLWTFSFIGWAYFAWAVISATGGGTRPRVAWRTALAAVLVQLALLALRLACGVVTLIAAPSGDPNLISDIAVTIYRAACDAGPLLTITSWLLLLAAFAAGLGNPAAVEPEAEHLELDPLPTPGRGTASAARGHQAVARLEHRLEARHDEDDPA